MQIFKQTVDLCKQTAHVNLCKQSADVDLCKQNNQPIKVKQM